MPHLDESIVINRPSDEVCVYLTDWFNAPRMSGSGIIGLRQSSPGPMGVGSKLLWPFIGRFVRRRMHASFAHTKAMFEAKD